MKTTSILVFVIGLIALTSFSPINSTFPNMEGITLEDKEISLPNDTKGKYTFLALAFSRKAEDHLNTWSEPIFFNFMPQAKSKAGMFGNDVYDVNLYFIPMFSGAGQLAEGKARKDAVEHMDKRLHSKMLFYKGSIKDYKDQLDMEEKDEPYFFLLDEKGKIVHTCKGAYTDAKMTKIQNILDDALGF